MSEMIDSNECIFININNPKVQDKFQKNNTPCPPIKPPFPPLIDPKDLLIIGKDNKPTRSPNAFIIYRKVYFKTARNEGHILPMTAISSMASQSWEQESDEIKKYYKKLAKEAYNYRIKCFPKKINKRSKREKWNIVSFKSDSSSNSSRSTTSHPSPIVDNKIPEDAVRQLPTPVEDVFRDPLFMNLLFQKLIMPNELSQEQTYPNLSLNNENLASPDLSEWVNPLPFENLQPIENNNNGTIERKRETQQFITGDLQLSFPQNLTTDNSVNSFDNLTNFLENSQPNFTDFFNNFKDDNVTNVAATENFDLLTNFTQRDDLGITFANEGFFSL